ncbi:flagellar hook-length control protein FliK [Arthrobacter sp. A5]|uniref:flagellar hook-length control protein FliK n=1 Tax=Arthrobacter sp. A5 TaxID=576926 RepID=UPI003DA90CFE
MSALSGLQLALSPTRARDSGAAGQSRGRGGRQGEAAFGAVLRAVVGTSAGSAGQKSAPQGTARSGKPVAAGTEPGGTAAPVAAGALAPIAVAVPVGGSLLTVGALLAADPLATGSLSAAGIEPGPQPADGTRTAEGTRTADDAGADVPPSVPEAVAGASNSTRSQDAMRSASAPMPAAAGATTTTAAASAPTTTTTPAPAAGAMTVSAAASGGTATPATSLASPVSSPAALAAAPASPTAAVVRPGGLTSNTPAPTASQTTFSPGDQGAPLVPGPIVSLQAAPAASGTPVPRPSGAPQPAPVPLASQISGPLAALATARPGEHVMTVRIAPDALGPVTVRAHISADNIRIELYAPNDSGRDALRAALPDLKRVLAATGMNASLDLASGNQPGRDPDARDPEAQGADGRTSPAPANAGQPGNRQFEPPGPEPGVSNAHAGPGSTLDITT